MVIWYSSGDFQGRGGGGNLRDIMDATKEFSRFSKLLVGTSKGIICLYGSCIFFFFFIRESHVEQSKLRRQISRCGFVLLASFHFDPAAWHGGDELAQYLRNRMVHRCG